MEGLLFFLLPIAICSIALNYRALSHGTQDLKTTQQFKAFQSKFLFTYIFALASDWIQGPYTYVLYASYNLTETEISRIFVVGFLSALCSGFVIGAVADSMGRKKACIAYCIFHTICCIGIQIPYYPMLLFARMCNGVGCTLLWTIFEAWMVHEHHCNHFPASWLNDTFSKAMLANGVVAVFTSIISGPLTQVFGGKTACFNVAILFLLVTAISIAINFNENYGGGVKNNKSNLEIVGPPSGMSHSLPALHSLSPSPKLATDLSLSSVVGKDSSHSASDAIEMTEARSSISCRTTMERICTTPETCTHPILPAAFEKGAKANAHLKGKKNSIKKCIQQGSSTIEALLLGLHVVITSLDIALCGGILSTFEAAMTLFLVEWTPALPSDANHPLIYSGFAICLTAGTGIFSLLVERRVAPLELLLAASFFIASVSLFIASINQNIVVRLFTFFLFEIVCGIYYPGVATLRSARLPDAQRATLLNLFRVPINGIVALVLAVTTYLGTSRIIMVASCLLALSALQAWYLSIIPKSKRGGYKVVIDSTELDIEMESHVSL